MLLDRLVISCLQGFYYTKDFRIPIWCSENSETECCWFVSKSICFWLYYKSLQFLHGFNEFKILISTSSVMLHDRLVISCLQGFCYTKDFRIPIWCSENSETDCCRFVSKSICFWLYYKSLQFLHGFNEFKILISTSSVMLRDRLFISCLQGFCYTEDFRIPIWCSQNSETECCRFVSKSICFWLWL
jgi:hypothetical protein